MPGNQYGDQIPEAIWVQIRERYVNGNESCKTIADDLQIAHSAVSTRCHREGWRDLRGQRKLKEMALKSENGESGKDAKLLAMVPSAPKPPALDVPLPEPEEVAERIKREGIAWLDYIQEAKANAEKIGTAPGKIVKELLGPWRTAADSVSKAYGLNEQSVQTAPALITLTLNAAPKPVSALEMESPPGSATPKQLPDLNH